MSSTTTPLVEMDKMTKAFGGVKAVDGVDFEVRENEVVALVGDNGAGKSTLIKLLAGVHRPDSGTISMEGQPLQFSHPSDAIAKGIQVIYQDLALVETFDLPSNFFLGKEVQRPIVGRFFNLLDQRRMSQEAREVVRDRLGITIRNWYQPVRVLSGGQRQAVAVARAVHASAKLIVMDEPTAALGVSETERLFEMIKRLKEQGLSFIVIAHNLEHVFAVADRIVVMWHGKNMGSRQTNETNREEIVRMMLGQAQQKELV